MCSIVIFRNPSNTQWPVLVAQVRDEYSTRPWQPPARHWPDKPTVVAGLDEKKGGTWSSLNDHGLLVTVINPIGSSYQTTGATSRGHLVLALSEQKTAVQAQQRLTQLHQLGQLVKYPDFILVVAHHESAFCCTKRGNNVEIATITNGTSMITPYGLNHRDCPRHQRFITLFRDKAPNINPLNDNWSAWVDILQQQAPAESRFNGMTVTTSADGFGTLCSSLLALSPSGDNTFKFCAGYPSAQRYNHVNIRQVTAKQI